MILVLAGTQDGRELAALLERAGFPVLVSVVSGYGRDLARQTGLLVHTGPLDRDGLYNLIRTRAVKLVVDASHPYAAAASENAIAACQRAGVRYLRYERPGTPLPRYEKLYVADNAAAAARLSAELGRTIFLTVGSRALTVFKQETLLLSHRLVARVLPDPAVVAECLRLGFRPRDIIAMQGPFSHELNVAMFRACNAEVVVTKNSGAIGGTDTKFSAAMELGLSLVVIDRPHIDYGCRVSSPAEVLDYIREEL
ncbi:precorrin-6A reductase [Sporolituus thermophilus]|uniref:Precorrin-6A/cobalt-precorrin-6A reductase n=1 Tax=Sporolituus thermophilus DSM 23256 TaxID=1123285 RepID=A0A1G7I4Z5_9FIRM|nr:precorrin-6A reductase [Sporolituus thermophilus]SDF07817.1 precorrin-6A/cobalt-precorrin-6A reductase [Sporolituus thermophilus DSM 23256]